MKNFPLTKKQINIIKNFGNCSSQAIPNMDGFTEINIYNEYFKKYNFKNKNILELGPGQCQFLRLFNNNNLFGIDLDPFVKELGDTLNIEIDNCNGYTNSKLLNNNTKYDVIFCKGSIDINNMGEIFFKKMDEYTTDKGIIFIIPWLHEASLGLKTDLDNIKEKKELLTRYGYTIIKLNDCKFTSCSYKYKNDVSYGFIFIKYCK